MMDNEIQKYFFENKPVRVVKEDNETWFVAKDITAVLEYSYWQPNIISIIPDEWKGIKRINTLGGEQSMSCLTEQGVYFFLARSDKEKAIPFQKWLAGEVVPSIRKHGAYMTPEMIEKTLTNPDFIIGLCQRLKEEQAKTQHLESRVQADAPKVLFADAVSVSSSEILVGDLAKLLKQNGVDIGQNRLFEKLREDGYLMKQGSARNMPTQRSMDMGLFRIKETVINKPDGSVLITRTPKLTGKGQLYFVNYFLNGKEAA